VCLTTGQSSLSTLILLKKYFVVGAFIDHCITCFDFHLIHPRELISRARELLRMGTIEPDLVLRLQLSPMVIAMWENWEHVIRERENFFEYDEGFEYLYNELKRIRSEKGYQEYKYPQPE